MSPGGGVQFSGLSVGAHKQGLLLGSGSGSSVLPPSAAWPGLLVGAGLGLLTLGLVRPSLGSQPVASVSLFWLC